MKKQIIVTTSWDDGHKLDLKLARLLKKYGIKGTFYVSPENQEFKKSDLLSQKEIVTLSKDLEIGAHTLTHLDLTKISLSEAEKEICESKKYLENILNEKIKAFCYPGGKYNFQIRKIIEKSGFKIARTTERFAKEMGNDLLALPTTVHAYTHWSDLKNIPLLINNKSIQWDFLAKKYFDDVLNHGGVFHLWGHSWEIEKFGYWQKLENIFAYIRNKRGVVYLNNSDLIK